MRTSEQQAIFAISITVIVSFIYNYFLDRINSVVLKRTCRKTVLLYLARKIIGFTLLGITPGLFYRYYFDFRPLRTVTNISITEHLWVWLVAISILLILLNLINARSSDLQKVYPEMRLSEWNFTSLSIAGGGWILYLTGYEYLFRGILLFSCINAFGVWMAVTINLALYSSLHLYKGLKEAIAAIPFGLFICYITIESNSILPAIFIHTLQAISAEIACIYRNPEMTFLYTKRKKS